MSFSVGRLKLYRTGSKIESEASLITSEETSSYPELFFVFKVLRAAFNSSSVIGFFSKDG